jgi:FkbM family methyltransferase
MKTLIKRFVKPFPALERHARRLGYLLANRVRFRRPQKTYAQYGEDLLIASLMRWLRIERPTYLDIGAHHPTYLSNTYLLYKRGSRGVCIEPDPELFVRLARVRRKDKHLNVGIGFDDTRYADFYVMSARGLNTFSAEEAQSHVAGGHSIERTIKVPLRQVNEVIQEHFEPWPNIISIDVEGLDGAILKSLDFNRFRPEAFCVETLCTTDLSKRPEIMSLMLEKDYMIFADTFTNTIFVEGKSWRNARQVVSEAVGIPT